MLTFVAFQSCEDSKSPAVNSEQISEKKQKVDRSKIDHIGNLIRRLKEKVTLTAEQEAKIRSIGKEYSFVGKERQEIRKIKQEFRKRLENDVLTKEQIDTILDKNN